MTSKLIGYKGFDKNLKCRDFQYEIGKEHVHEGDVKLCAEGFHFCERPLDILEYYAVRDGSRFAIVEAEDVSKQKESGDYGAASNSGTRGAASNSGDSGAASNSGDYGAASNSGEEGVAISVGREGRAMSSLGGWITLSEWTFRDGDYHRIDVQTKMVDGKKIKADTFYQLKGGKFVEA